MNKFDPLNNLGTSKVLYLLLSECKTPKELADSLGIKPPPVIEQLRRLQKIGIVRRGEKKGKLQEYEINFDKFLELFIERALQEKMTYPRSVHSKEIATVKTLKGNRYFKKLVKEYLKNLCPFITADKAAKEFEDALLHSTALKRKKTFKDDPEKQDFFDKMRLWRKIAEKKMTFAELNFQDALTKVLYPKQKMK